MTDPSHSSLTDLVFTYYLLPTYLLPGTQAEKKHADAKKRKMAKITGKVSERHVEKQQRQAAACFAAWGLRK